jgi:hypothetical protein
VGTQYLIDQFVEAVDIQRFVDKIVCLGILDVFTKSGKLIYGGYQYDAHVFMEGVLPDPFAQLDVVQLWDEHIYDGDIRTAGLDSKQTLHAIFCEQDSQALFLLGFFQDLLRYGVIFDDHNLRHFKFLSIESCSPEVYLSQRVC